VNLPPSEVLQECGPGRLVVELDNEPGVKWKVRAKRTGRFTLVLLVRGGSC